MRYDNDINKQAVHMVRRGRHLSTSPPPSLGHTKVTNLSPFSSCCIIELRRTSNASWSWWCQRRTRRRIRKAWRKIWHYRHLAWLRGWRHYLLVLISQIWIPQDSLIFWWSSPPSFRQQVFTRKWLNMYTWTSTLRRFSDWCRDWHSFLNYQWWCGRWCSNWNWLLINRQLRARCWLA